MKHIITIKEQCYELNMNAALEQKNIKRCDPIKVSDLFEDPVSKEKYLLMHCGFNDMALVSISSGNMFSRPVRVANRQYITSDEFYHISNGTDLNRMNNVSIIENVPEKVDSE